MKELQLLSTVDRTRRLEYDLLGTWKIVEDKDKQGAGQNKASHRRRLTFSLAVRKGRFARYNLLIGSRYGVWSTADRRLIKRTNFYHYHHITQGIIDVRDNYEAVIMDGFYDAHTIPSLLFKLLFVHPRRAALVVPTICFYYHMFLAKDRRMECWPDMHRAGKKRTEELSSVRHRLVDVYRRRMSPAQMQRSLVVYERDRRYIRWSRGFVVGLMLVLFVIIVWLLNYLVILTRTIAPSRVPHVPCRTSCSTASRFLGQAS